MDSTNRLTCPSASQRHSQRIVERVPVLVCGFLSYKLPFEEETETLVINAHGALVLLATRVIADQELVLKHRQTHEHQECIVAYLGPEQSGKRQIGLKFTAPNPSFWRNASAPEDWNPSLPRALIRDSS
jgi:hypothetical protein